MTKTILSIGATGSIGHHVVEQILAKGYHARALVRDAERANRLLPAGAELVVGDGTDPEAVARAVAGIDAVVFTHGSHGGANATQTVDYGIVRNVLTALSAKDVYVSLMTSIGVTVHDGAYNRSSGAHDWKRRSERLVRRSGHPYTIVRPGWFDYNEPDQRRIVFLQGDTRRAGNSSDGVIARDQIARVLVDAIDIPAATLKTLELVAESGPEQSDLTQIFSDLQGDVPGAADAVLDPDTLPLKDEPADVLAQLGKISQ